MVTTDPGRDGEWVMVWTAVNALAAELLRSRLESAGVPVELIGSGLGPVYALNAGPLAEVKVYVPAEFACLARKILAEPEQPAE